MYNGKELPEQFWFTQRDKTICRADRWAVQRASSRDALVWQRGLEEDITWARVVPETVQAAEEAAAKARRGAAARAVTEAKEAAARDAAVAAAKAQAEAQTEAAARARAQREAAVTMSARMCASAAPAAHMKALLRDLQVLLASYGAQGLGNAEVPHSAPPRLAPSRLEEHATRGIAPC